MRFRKGHNHRTAIPNRVRVSLLLFFGAVLIGLMPACGKKGPPFLAEKQLDARVDALTGTWKDGEIRLEGTIHQGADKGAPITGCVVDHAWYPEDQSPCEGCPIEMSPFSGPVDTTISGDRLICTIPVSKTGGTWFWEVRLTGAGGAVGPPSKRVRLKD
jgi:hypothetical protein